MGIVTQTLRVQGMHCTNCENIVERTLGRLRGVRTVKADFGSETVVVTYDDSRCTIALFAKALKPHGYECDPAPLRHPIWDGVRRFLRMVLGLAGIMAIFYAGSRISALGTLPQLEHQAGIGLLFLAGLLTGFHCVGMCGGFVVSYTAGVAAGRLSHGLAHLAYGLGKTLSYSAIGALFGFAGGLISFTPSIRGAAAIAAGIFLLGFGLNMLHLLPHLKVFRLPMPRWLGRFVYAESRKHRHPFLVGLLNGLMIACGPLQAMYVMAAGTGSAVEGARILFAFGLGTLPLLLGFGFLTSLISHQVSNRILQASGLIVVVLGLIMLNRGLILTGSGYDFASVANWVSRTAGNLQGRIELAEGGRYQIVHTKVTAEGFEPSTITVRKGVPVRWTLTVTELTDCNRAVIIPELNLQFDLHPGEQTVEFTPDREGLILWSCWMGMLRGELQILDDSPTATEKYFDMPPPVFLPP